MGRLVIVGPRAAATAGGVTMLVMDTMVGKRGLEVVGPGVPGGTVTLSAERALFKERKKKKKKSVHLSAAR
jgi:hypothetical protein